MDNVPKKGPVIFAVNHQNSFLDALLVTTTTPRNPYYLARGDVFGISWISYLLNFINIMPIYRSRDGIKNVRKNEAIIDRCTKILGEGHPVLIFPEANHEYKNQLRAIQKGVSRIAFAANAKHPVRIVPVGIQFENYRKAGYPVLVTYGDPIDVADYQKSYTENNQRGHGELINYLQSSMQRLIVDIQHDQYDVIHRKWISNRSLHSDSIMQLREDQKLVREITSHPEKFDSSTHSPKRSANWPFLPFYILSSILFIIPWAVTSLTLARMKDDQYIASLKVAIWFFLVPEIILLQGVLIGMISNAVIALGFITLSLLSGWITIKRYFPL